MIPAITYFRTGRHYHRLQGLNCRVRNGNECGPPDMVTGKSRERKLELLPGRTSLAVYTNGSGKQTFLFTV